MEIKATTSGPDIYMLNDGGSGNIVYNEPRFMEDDLNTLVALGLLRLEFVGNGTRKFFVTRDAVRLAKNAAS